MLRRIDPLWIIGLCIVGLSLFVDRFIVPPVAPQIHRLKNHKSRAFVTSRAIRTTKPVRDFERP